MRTEREITAEFGPADRVWPMCVCGESAQGHGLDGRCPERGCRGYRPMRPLTPLQAELAEARKAEAEAVRLRRVREAGSRYKVRVYVEFEIYGDDPRALRDRAEEIGDELVLPADATDFGATAEDPAVYDPDGERSNGPRRA